MDQMRVMPNRQTKKLGLNALITVLTTRLLAYVGQTWLMHRL
jgi:hypothetical protein